MYLPQQNVMLLIKTILSLSSLLSVIHSAAIENEKTVDTSASASAIVSNILNENVGNVFEIVKSESSVSSSDYVKIQNTEIDSDSDSDEYAGIDFQKTSEEGQDCNHCPHTSIHEPKITLEKLSRERYYSC